MSPTARTLAWLRNQGYIAEVVERWNHFAKIRHDFGGFADILAYKETVAGVLAIQTTSDANVSNRVQKCSQNSKLGVWLRSGCTFWVVGWSRKGKRGKRKIWTPRVIPFAKEGFGCQE